MKIVTPSYKRAGRVLSRRVFPDCIIACHEFEEEEYREKEGGELAVIPDSKQGNIARVRNWILDNIEDDQIVMIDDDMRGFGYHENLEQIPMDPDQAVAFIEMGYQMAEGAKVHLWGVNLQADPKFYREFSPFSFLSPVLGTFSAHLKAELRYDESITLKEDYDFFLKNIHRHRKVLRFNKYWYLVDHLDNSGGCTSYRMKETEMEHARILQKRWGKSVVQYDIGKSVNPKLFVPIQGI